MVRLFCGIWGCYLEVDFYLEGGRGGYFLEYIHGWAVVIFYYALEACNLLDLKEPEVGGIIIIINFR